MKINCCSQWSTFCGESGEPILSQMMFKNGQLIMKNFNLDGSIYEDGLVFTKCPPVPITNLIDIGVRMNALSCVSGQLSNLFSIEVQNNLAGIVNGSIIKINVSFNNSNYNDYELEIADSNYNLLAKDTIQIINASLFSGFINNIKIKYLPIYPSSCAPVSIAIDPIGIYNLAPSYGIGTLSGDTKTIL